MNFNLKLSNVTGRVMLSTLALVMLTFVQMLGQTTTILTVSRTNLYFPATGGGQIVQVQSTSPWSISGSVPGFDITKVSATELKVVASSNVKTDTTTQKRTGTFNIVAGADSTAKKVTITVSQDGKLAASETTLQVFPSKLNFSSTGHTLYVIVRANKDWTVAGSVPGFTYEKLSSTKLAITASSNKKDTTSTTVRGGSFDIIAGTGTGAKTAKVEVSQAGYTVVNKVYLSVSPTYAAFPATGGTAELSVKSSAAWTVRGSVPGFTITAVGTDKLSIVASSNVDSSATSLPRKGVVYVVAGTGDNAKSQPVVVYQEGRLSVNETLLFAAPNYLSFSALGGTQLVKVASTAAWTLENKTIPGFTMTKVDSVTVSVVASSNIDSTKTTTKREGEFNIIAGTKKVTIKVTQAGKELGATTNFFEVSPKFLVFEPEGGTKNVEIKASGAWTVGAAPAGFTVTKEAAGLKITAASNIDSTKSTLPRTGIIEVTMGADSTAKKAYISVTQLGKGVEIKLPTPSTASISPLALSFPAEGGKKTVVVKNAGNWSASSNLAAFTTAKIDSLTLEITAAANDANMPRIGSVAVKSGDKTIGYVSILQAAKSSTTTNTSGFYVFPNPAVGVSWINFSKETAYEIIDEKTGKVVLFSTTAAKGANISTLTTGIYTVKTREGESTRFIK